MSKNKKHRRQRVSHHACERWVERIEEGISTWQARTRIQRVMGRAVRIPNRHAGSRWVHKHRPEADAKFRKRGTRYYFSPNAVLVIGSKTSVVTVMPTTPEDVATVLVWAIMGLWMNDDSPASKKVV
ncbi:hypothetical protein N9917_00265 [Deltaproteobacteria bacterium]|nr:hypothetical protein [Deltaproteobacteria bacterium]